MNENRIDGENSELYHIKGLVLTIVILGSETTASDDGGIKWKMKHEKDKTDLPEKTLFVCNLCTYWGGSPGLVVMGGDSCSEVCGFESLHCILYGHFSHLFDVKF